MTASAITLYGKMLAFSRVQIHTTDILHIQSSLVAQIVSDNTLPVPIVLEVADGVAVDELFFDSLVERLWQDNLAVIAVMDGALSAVAQAKKMAILPSDGKRIARVAQRQTADIPESVLQNTSSHDVNKLSMHDHEACHQADVKTDATICLDESADVKQDSPVADETYVAKHCETNNHIHQMTMNKEPIRICNQMLRSGQSIHHMGADLVITSVVNSGAEVVTDNNLHIYGKAQGRLVAGATGDENTHIFCQVFEPSLVSVAGTYCLKEDIPSDVLGKAVQVSFDKKMGLVFQLMSDGDNQSNKV